MTNPNHNPLVGMDINWTDEMASDFRKYKNDVKDVFPVCGLLNLTTVAVSISNALVESNLRRGLRNSYKHNPVVDFWLIVNNLVIYFIHLPRLNATILRLGSVL